MDKMRIAVVGFGNIGRFAVDAVEVAPDMELAGVVCPEADTLEEPGRRFVRNMDELEEVEVALLCVPTRLVADQATRYLKQGIHTVDVYDIHDTVWELVQTLEPAALEGNACAVVAAGWDPGCQSVVRALLEACAPRGITHTNFGPGMSMGHTVAAKAVEGVANALSMTIPTGNGVHRRMVYVRLKPGADFHEVEAAIKADPYFCRDEVHVFEVEDVEALMDRGHAGHITRKGVSGKTDNQLFSFDVTINNPALTSQIMVSCARAAAHHAPGAYTMLELPVISLLPGEREKLIRRHV